MVLARLIHDGGPFPAGESGKACVGRASVLAGSIVTRDKMIPVWGERRCGARRRAGKQEDETGRWRQNGYQSGNSERELERSDLLQNEPERRSNVKVGGRLFCLRENEGRKARARPLQRKNGGAGNERRCFKTASAIGKRNERQTKGTIWTGKEFEVREV